MQNAVFGVIKDHVGQIFEVDLMNDAGVRRHDAKVAEGFLAPAQEGIAFLIAAEFENRVFLKGLGGAEGVYLNGMVDYQVGGNERVGEFGL